MSMEKELFEQLCSAYALGSIEADEQTRLDEALASGSEEFQNIFRESVGVSYSINSCIKRNTPPPIVRTRILQRVQYGDSVPSALFMWFERLAATLGFGRPGFGLLVAILLVIVIAEIGTYAYMVSTELDAIELPAAATEERLAALEQRISSVTAELNEKNDITSVLNSPGMKVAILRGQESSMIGGKILWDPEHMTAVLHFYGLPNIAESSAFQLWITGNDAATLNAGIFSLPDSTNQYIQVIPLPRFQGQQEIASFILTVEPNDGSGHPTGPTIVSGSPIAVRK